MEKDLFNTYLVKVKAMYSNQEVQVLGIIVDATDPNSAFKSVFEKLRLAAEVYGRDRVRYSAIDITRVDPSSYECDILIAVINRDNLDIIIDALKK